MLPKPGKNVKLPESYRPITLLPAISKVFEKLLLRHIVPHFTPRDEQFGFRSEHSTTLQLTRILHRMTETSNGGRFTCAVLLDMEKAFDRVWHSGLLFKILNTNIPRRVARVIASFLEGRSFHVTIGGLCSNTYPIAAGVPQGSCLSPVLYCCYTDDIPLAERDVELALYADDAAYFSVSMNPKMAATYMQRQLDLLPEWLTEWRLRVNVKKTQAILIRRQDRGMAGKPHPPPLQLCGQAVDWSRTVTYLGVKIDSKITMKPHIRMIRPILTYAAPAWYALCKDASRDQMQAQQNKTLRTITGAPFLMRNSVIAKDLRMESLNDFIVRLTTRMFSRADASDYPHIRDLTPLHSRPPDGKLRYARDLVPLTSSESDSSSGSESDSSD